MTTIIYNKRATDAYYSRMVERHGIKALGKYHLARWLKVRAWLKANDPDYIWDN